MGLKRAAQACRPFLDSEESQALGLAGVEAYSVILDREEETILPLKQLYPDSGGLGMFGAVVQCFLDHAINASLVVVWKIIQIQLGRNANVHRRALGTFPRLPFQRGN